MIANELSCMEEALTVVAAMSCETVFDQDDYREDGDADRMRARSVKRRYIAPCLACFDIFPIGGSFRFATNISDHLTVLNVVQAFKQEQQRGGRHLKVCIDIGF